MSNVVKSTINEKDAERPVSRTMGGLSQALRPNLKNRKFEQIKILLNSMSSS